MANLDRKNGFSFEDAIDLVSLADSAEERRSIVEQLAKEARAPWTKWLRHRAHIIARGGGEAVLREAFWEDEDSEIHRVAEEYRRRDSRGLRLLPYASSRTCPSRDNKITTYETGLCLYSVRFGPGQRSLFAYGDGWLSGKWGTWFLQWSLEDYALVSSVILGQSRDERARFALSPTGGQVATSDFRNIGVFEFPSLRPLLRLSGCEGTRELAFINETSLLSLEAPLGPALELWNAADGQKLATVATTGWSSFAVSPDKSWVAVDGSEAKAMVVIHELPSLKLLRTFKDGVSRAHVHTVAVAGNEGPIATGDDRNRVILWSLDRGECHRLGEHAGWVEASRFMSNGARLATGGWDGAIRLWDIQESRSMGRLGSHAGIVYGLDGDSSRDVLASCGSDGDVHIWCGDATHNAPPHILRYGFVMPKLGFLTTDDGVLSYVDYDKSKDKGRKSDRVEWCKWSAAGTRLDPGAIEMAPPPISTTTRSVKFTGVDLEVRIGADRWLEIRNFSSGMLVDTVALDQQALALAAMDDNRLVVFDRGGHVSFWRIA